MVNWNTVPLVREGIMLEEICGNTKDITNMRKQYRSMPVYGFDTETPCYTPRLLSISDGITNNLFDVKPENIFDQFLAYFDTHGEKENIVFAHNLQYDMTVMLNQGLKFFLLPEFNLKYGKVKISFFNDNPYFGEIKYPNGKVLHLRDTYAFFGRIKLADLSRQLEIDTTKVDISADMHSDPNAHKNARYRHYSRIDAKCTCLIGQRIMEFHAIDDIPLCVSGPQMSMTVFRKKFIPQDSLLPKVSQNIRHWELSYHGGKNGCYVQTPCDLKGISLYDINSAYPYAMTQIPNFLNCRYKHIAKPRMKDLIQPGIVQITAKSNCRFNSTFEHDFTPTKDLKNVWITTYELDSLLAKGCIDNLKLHQAEIVIPSGNSYNPLADFARTYFELKNSEPKKSALYLYYKVCMLNALYGKFIERRQPIDCDYSIRGPNYNPAIASLITGHTRAYMHQMEHDLNSIHSATDSVFTEGSMDTSKELGGVSCEGKGRLKLLRTKLYMFYDGKGKMQKYALHGFHAPIAELEQIWKEKRSFFDDSKKSFVAPYSYNKMPKPGEYFIHKNLHLKMFGFNQMESSLNLDMRKVYRQLIPLTK